MDIDFVTASPEALVAFAEQATDEAGRLGTLVRGLAALRVAVAEEAGRLAKWRLEVEQLTARWSSMAADIAAVEELRAALQKGD